MYYKGRSLNFSNVSFSHSSRRWFCYDLNNYSSFTKSDFLYLNLPEIKCCCPMPSSLSGWQIWHPQSVWGWRCCFHLHVELDTCCEGGPSPFFDEWANIWKSFRSPSVIVYVVSHLPISIEVSSSRCWISGGKIASSWKVTIELAGFIDQNLWLSKWYKS